MIKIQLRELLSERGITQSDLAKKTGIRPSTVCDIYNGNCTFLKLEHIDRICSALGCGIDNLIVYYD